MQEVQRFNKVLKSCVLLGDLILLNLLLWGFEQFLVTALVRELWFHPSRYGFDNFMLSTL